MMAVHTERRCAPALVLDALGQAIWPRQRDGTDDLACISW
jgi:hypothetical protein